MAAIVGGIGRDVNGGQQRGRDPERPAVTRTDAGRAQMILGTSTGLSSAGNLVYAQIPFATLENGDQFELVQ